MPDMPTGVLADMECIVAGKTTQVPQYILDKMLSQGRGAECNILCTQPRRISAISIAQRIAQERAEGEPGSRGSLVGYQVRLESAQTAATRLMFCTTGILLRRLQQDDTMQGVSHVILDEVHERDVQVPSTILLVSLCAGVCGWMTADLLPLPPCRATLCSSFSNGFSWRGRT